MQINYSSIINLVLISKIKARKTCISTTYNALLSGKPLLAQTQQVLPGVTYLPVALAYRREAFPHGMTDDTEVAFENDGALLLRGNFELTKIEKQPVKIAVLPILGRLHTTNILNGQLLAGLTGRGCRRR